MSNGGLMMAALSNKIRLSRKGLKEASTIFLIWANEFHLSLPLGAVTERR